MRIRIRWCRLYRYMQRVDALGAAALVLDKRPVLESEFTPDQLNGAFLLRNEGLLYKEDREAGGIIWRPTSVSRLHEWACEEAGRLGIDLNGYQPERADPPGTTLIPVNDYPAPR